MRKTTSKMKASIASVITLFIALSNVITISASQNYDFCSACRAIILEADEMIREVDPKKTIQSGSFRVDPDGNQKIQEIQYARSNTHLEEVVDTVCDKMHQYADRLFEDGSKQLVRIQGYSDAYNDELKLDYKKGKSLKYQCEIFLEDHEEDIITYLQEENIPNYEAFVCAEKTGVCTAQQLDTQVETIQRPKERHGVDVEEEDEDEEDEDDEDEDDEEEDHDEL